MIRYFDIIDKTSLKPNFQEPGDMQELRKGSWSIRDFPSRPQVQFHEANLWDYQLHTYASVDKKNVKDRNISPNLCSKHYNSSNFKLQVGSDSQVTWEGVGDVKL